MKHNAGGLYERQKAYWLSGRTKEIAFRKNALSTLKNGVKKRERQLLSALAEDLGKSAYEGYMTEIGMVYEEIDLAVRELEDWARPERVKTPLSLKSWPRLSTSRAKRGLPAACW